MVALNLGEMPQVTTGHASNCWSKRRAEGGAVTTLSASAGVQICTTDELGVAP